MQSVPTLDMYMCIFLLLLFCKSGDHIFGAHKIYYVFLYKMYILEVKQLLDISNGGKLVAE